MDASLVALAWLLAHPAQIIPVLGTNNLDRLQTLSAATKVLLTRQDWFEIYTAALGHEVP
jgi:predicted oxidoreductase